MYAYPDPPSQFSDGLVSFHYELVTTPAGTLEDSEYLDIRTQREPVFQGVEP